jgi:Flp pilus assembly protein TadD/cell division protein FtsN
MNRRLYQLATSTMILSLIMVGTTAQSQALRRVDSATPAEARSERQASEFHEQARRALQQGNLAEATSAIEQAVALSPRDAGYRLLLADIYLRSGRFDSARASYSDVLDLDQGNVRAGLSYSLMQIALGRPQAAVAQLDSMGSNAAPADVGLAYALAGLPERAIEVLEPAARGPGANARLRQNLALSYALAGDWRRSRTVASQDLPPSEVRERMVQWAQLARPEGGPGQIAALLGVNPIADPGQPVRLALRGGAVPVQVAEAAPAAEAPVYAEVAPAAAPAQASVSDWGLPAAEATAEAAPVDSRPYYTPAPQAAPTTRALAAASPTVVRASAVSLPPAPAFQRQRPAHANNVRAGNSNYVVQIGAFSNEANAERAWLNAQRRFELGQRAPLTATISANGRTMHRVAIAGFAGRDDAARMCASIRADGGVCFVRNNAGDASVRWAARYARDGTRRA